LLRVRKPTGKAHELPMPVNDAPARQKKFA
jgi:hypothetical protein